MSGTTLKIEKLESFIKALRKSPPKTRVGILGDSASRKSESSKAPLTNAQVGAAHEFNGRSFLRIPLIDNLVKELKASGAFDKKTFQQVINSGTIVPWCKKMAIVAEGIVIGGFATGGYGKWRPSNMKFKKNHQTLVETQQLRNSITSEVKE